jgi:cytoskeletal protein RodZ
MADDNTLRPYRSSDPYRRAAEPPRPSQEASARDPLAELARLLGQSDPFADLGRSNSRERQQDAHDAPATAPEDWQGAPVREPQVAAGGDTQRRSAQGSSYGSNYATSRDYAHPAAPERADWRAESRVYDEPEHGADQQSQHYDEQSQHYGDDHTDDGQYDAQEAEYAYQDDVPLQPHEDELYDDAPRARRGGFATALALIGCAVLGTAGAYAYRSYFGHPSSTQPPPVITADNSTPTKIVPASAGDPQASNVAQDRSANADKERIASKQEEPVALKESASQAAPRVVQPAPVPPGQGASTSTEPKKIRTVVIHPDASDVSAKPVTSQSAAAQAAAASRPTAPPAVPKAATASAARNSGPISLDPQSSEPAAAPPARVRTAAAPPPSTRSAPEATESAAGGFLVQLSSQKSEAEAHSSFRSLQAKFPNELGDLQPIIRRADLGSKGVFYRTLVGPFTSAQEASQFCANYKAAGGQCVVPNN